MAEDGNRLVDELLSRGYQPDLLQVSALNTNESCPVFPGSVDMTCVSNAAAPKKGREIMATPRLLPDEWFFSYSFGQGTEVPDLLAGASITMNFPGFRAPEGYRARYIPYPATQAIRSVSVNIGDAHLCRNIDSMGILTYSQYEGEHNERYLGHDPRYVTWQQQIPSFTTRVPIPIYAFCQGYIPLFPLQDQIQNLTMNFTIRRNAVHFLQVQEIDSGRILSHSEIVELDGFPDDFSIDAPTSVRMHTIRLGESERADRIRDMKEMGDDGYGINILTYITMPPTDVITSTTNIHIVTHNHGQLRSIMFSCGRKENPSDVGENERRIQRANLNVSGVTPILNQDEFELRSHTHQIHTHNPKSEGFCSFSLSCSRIDASAEKYFSFAQGVGGMLVVELDSDCVDTCQIHGLLEVKRVLRYVWDADLKRFNVRLS